MNAFQMEILLKGCPDAENEIVKKYLLAVEEGTHILENDIDTYEELIEDFDYFRSIHNNCK